MILKTKMGLSIKILIVKNKNSILKKAKKIKILRIYLCVLNGY